MYEKTEKDFNELFNEISQVEGFWDNWDFEIGKHDGHTFIIFQNHEAIIKLNALLNRYEGDTNFSVLWHDQNLNTEINKAVEELKNVDPTHLGTIGRLNSRIKGLENLSTYKRWLHNNGIDEPLSLDSFEDVDSGSCDEYNQCAGRCNGCENIIRTSPNSYCWTAPLYIESEGYVCDDCAPEYKDYVLEELCNCQKNIPDQFDVKDLGLSKVNDDSLANGLFRGMNDTPAPIIKSLNAVNIDVWFKVHPSQFYMEFDVYVRDADLEKAREVLLGTNTKLDYEPVDRLEAALKSIPPITNTSEGISYTKVNVDKGTSETRIVSKEEFIKGIKD